MLGSIVLLGCVIAAFAATAIVFVLYGPVPVNRRVARLSRLAPDPFVASPPAPAVAPPRVFASPVALLASGDVQTTREPDFDRPAPKADGTPSLIPLTVEKRRAVAAAEPVAPLRLRRPGNPPPLPPRRAARGSEAPHPVHAQGSSSRIHAQSTFDVEHTAADTSPFKHVVDTATFQRSAPFQYEDATFAEPGARVRRR